LSSTEHSAAKWIEKNKINLQIASSAALTIAAVAAVILTSMFTSGLATIVYATLLGTVGAMSLTAFIAGIMDRKEANEKELFQRYKYLERVHASTHRVWTPTDNYALFLFNIALR